jgi:hypothetical protein
MAAAQELYRRKVLEKTFFGQFLRKMRRTYLSTFRPDYIRQSIAENRKGECHRCGACCELVYKCPFLGRDAQNLPYCRVYGELRPGNCRNYPFDAIDSEIEKCGYSFGPK